ncbi:MAG TPA: hypothetical protein ENG58_06425 [Thermotogales bacterium]|nr:hypothetical protein [Thermotogales bacterium]
MNAVDSMIKILKSPPVSLCVMCDDESILEEMDERLVNDSNLGIKKSDLMKIGDWWGTVGIDDVRRVERFLRTPAEGRLKLVRIFGAENMNQEASNAFLKTLEEPPRKAVLILYTRNFYKLPSTVRSRVILITVQKPSRDEIMRILKEVEGLNEKKIWDLFVICRMSYKVLKFLKKKGKIDSSSLNFDRLDDVLTPDVELRISLYFEKLLYRVIESKSEEEILNLYDEFLDHLKKVEKDRIHGIVKKFLKFISYFLRDSLMARVHAELIEHKEFFGYFMKSVHDPADILNFLRELRTVYESQRGQMDHELVILWTMLKLWKTFKR